MSQLFGAVETGGTTVRCARGTASHDLEVVEFPTAGPAETTARIAGWFATGPAVSRLGVAAFGPLDLDPASASWGCVLRSPKPAWSGFPLGPELARQVGVPVVLDTDVNAAAVAEARGVDGSPLAYVTVGTGIGLGVAVGGRPLHGVLHPEAGHIRVPRQADDAFEGTCPLHGDCWEGLAAGPAIAARWSADPVELPPDHPAWDLEARYLAAGLTAVVLVLAPERIVLGGGVGRRSPLLDATRRALAGELSATLGARVGDSLVVAPRLGSRSGLAGAFALAGDPGRARPHG